MLSQGLQGLFMPRVSSREIFSLYETNKNVYSDNEINVTVRNESIISELAFRLPYIVYWNLVSTELIYGKWVCLVATLFI